jgi:hypothetical protein
MRKCSFLPGYSTEVWAITADNVSWHATPKFKMAAVKPEMNNLSPFYM